MEAAKQAVNKVIGRSGHHDTIVDETVNPAITQETIKPHRHEETVQAVDREVHQDHYHTTVQPLQHKEVLPERHTHNQLPVEEREFHHGETDRIKEGVQREAAQFANTSTTHQTTHTQSEAPVQAGEHVHHHVHERVQPVIHKETVQPEVVHTVRPVHETHHAQAEHHGISTLPTKTLDEFKELGGKITGNSHRHEEYEGHPRPYNPALQSARSPADTDPSSHDGLHGTHGTGATELSGTGGTTGGLTGSHHTGTSGTTGGLTGSHHTGTSGTTGGLTGGTAGGLTGSHHTGTSGTAGGLTGTSGTHVSGSGGDYSTGTGYGSGVSESTGTALGGRAEGNTAGRALDAVTGHGHHGHTSTADTRGVGSEGITGRGLEHSTAGHTSTGGSTTHHDRSLADTSSSTNTGDYSSAGGVGARDDVQSPSQGKDPSLVESSTAKTSGGGLKGEGVDGSHSAVFGLTPDGHKYDDTKHGSGALKPAHSKGTDNAATDDTGSRAATGAGVAAQLNDPRVNEKGHGGSSLSTTGSSKPGFGAPGGEQGLGQIRPGEHGAEDKLKNKLDPTTDADRDGKAGLLD